MLTKNVKSDKSRSIRLPKSILSSTEFADNKESEISGIEETLVISHAKQHKTLKERFNDYDGDYKCAEWFTGSPIGQEKL